MRRRRQQTYHLIWLARETTRKCGNQSTTKRSDGRVVGVRMERNYIDTSDSFRRYTFDSTFYKILAASSYRDPTKKFSLRLKRDVEIRRDIFLIILIGRSLRKIFRIDSFLFFFIPSLSLFPWMRFETKFAQAFRRFEKIKEKKIFSSIGGGSWKRIEISVPVRIGLNVTRHFPWASWNTRETEWGGRRPEIASKSSAIVLHGYGSRSKRIFHSS